MRTNPGTRVRIAAFLIVLASFTAAAATSADDDFEHNLQRARENLATEQGAAYDFQLGTAIGATPAVLSGISQCLDKYPGRHEMEGYFHFHARDAFRVVLRPENAFSACLASAFEGHALPAPPSVPYFNHFTFRTEQ